VSVSVSMSMSLSVPLSMSMSIFLQKCLRNAKKIGNTGRNFGEQKNHYKLDTNFGTWKRKCLECKKRRKKNAGTGNTKGIMRNSETLDAKGFLEMRAHLWKFICAALKQ